MDRVKILCNKDRVLMKEFSRRCIDDLRDHLIFKVFFTLFRGFMDANVQKETDKDRLIIEHAASAFLAGKDFGDADVDGMFEKTKGVDREFIKKISTLPLSIDVRYTDIGDIRKKRIRVLSRMVVELLNNWNDPIPFIDVVKKTYTDSQFNGIIKDMLHLYNLETIKLTGSIRLLYPADIAKGLFTDALFNMMEQIREVTAREFTKRVYGDI